MSLAKKSASALGKLFVLIALAATFAVGMAGVVYVRLQGDEIKVPELVGKDLNQSEQELAALGLQIKNRAYRFSTEKPNTILEQIPKAGETVKTGQRILVVSSKANAEGEEAPVTIKKSIDNAEPDDTEKIEELISDKPKKSNKTNSNAAANTNKKKTSTTRDTISGGSSNANSNANSSGGKNSNENSTKENKNAASDSNKSANPTEVKKLNTDAKPVPVKTPAKPVTSGDTRPRKTP